MSSRARSVGPLIGGSSPPWPTVNHVMQGCTRLLVKLAAAHERAGCSCDWRGAGQIRTFAQNTKLADDTQIKPDWRQRPSKTPWKLPSMWSTGKCSLEQTRTTMRSGILEHRCHSGRTADQVMVAGHAPGRLGTPLLETQRPPTNGL